MSETFTVQDMAVEHIRPFGKILAAMVAEAPQNYSITPREARAYGSTRAFFIGMRAAIAENKEGRYVVLNGGGQVIGAATTSQKPDSLRVGNMYIMPQFRSHGLGAMLLQACEDRGLSEGYPATSLVVSSKNERAKAFYERQGYRMTPDVEPAKWPIHDDTYGLLMKKILLPA